MSYVPTPPPPSPEWMRRDGEWQVVMVSYRRQIVDVLASYPEKEYFKLKLAGSLEEVLYEHYAEKHL